MGKCINKNDIINKEFGKLIVLEYSYTDKFGALYYKVQCNCNNKTIKDIRRGSLLRGTTQSCGCLKREIQKAMKHTFKHGMRNTSEYSVWHEMKARCYNKTHKAYVFYGKRGITVCDEWITDFMNFYNDMGKRPSTKHSLDRIDVNKGYYKENCRWATKSMQSQNRRLIHKNKTGYAGIFKRDGTRYEVTLCSTETNKNYNSIYLGSYKIIENAIAARQQAEMKYWKTVYTKYPIKCYSL